MRPFEYIRPASITEAIALLDRDANGSRLLAGGTDLLTLMKAEIATPSQLIDIKRLPELDDAIEMTPAGITIGALATLAEIETDPLIAVNAPALADAAAVAATPQLRNMATIGGNLLQRPRCWYFRSEHVTCWLNGGERCLARDGENQQHALFGDAPCVATHPSDLATALVALGADAVVQGPAEARVVPLEEFFQLPVEARRIEHTLGSDEVILSVTIPSGMTKGRSTYLKAMDRKAWAFALVGVAAHLVIENGHIVDARLVLGGVAPIPWRVPDAEKLLVGEPPSPELFARVAEAALEGAEPLSKNGYKIPLLRSLIPRALAAVSA